MPLKLIQPTIHLSIIQRLRPLTHTLKQQRLRIHFRIHTQNIQHDPRRRTVVPTSNDVPIADDKDELALVVVVESG